AEDGIRYFHVTGVQTCALPIYFQPAVFRFADILSDRRESTYRRDGPIQKKVDGIRLKQVDITRQPVVQHAEVEAYVQCPGRFPRSEERRVWKEDPSRSLQPSDT